MENVNHVRGSRVPMQRVTRACRRSGHRGWPLSRARRIPHDENEMRSKIISYAAYTRRSRFVTRSFCVFPALAFLTGKGRIRVYLNCRIISKELAITVIVRIVNKSRRGPRLSQVPTADAVPHLVPESMGHHRRVRIKPLEPNTVTHNESCFWVLRVDYDPTQIHDANQQSCATAEREGRQAYPTRPFSTNRFTGRGIGRVVGEDSHRIVAIGCMMVVRDNDQP